MNKLKWRLSKLPTPSELAELVKDKIITQEEAHEVLFDHVTEEELDADALKSEIQFLRKLVEDLSKSRGETVKVIEKHINHYRDYTWYQPYQTWCTTSDVITSGGGSVYLSNGVTASGAGATITTSGSLTGINTF